MGSGTMKCKSYHTNKGYYLAKDYDERFGGEFFFLLLPFFGNNGERFFYVTTEKNSYTVEGEYYIIMDESKVRKEVRLFQKELGKKPIWYYHKDNQGRVLRKEKHT